MHELFPGRLDQRVGSGRVGLGRVGSGKLTRTAGRVQALAGRVGSGPSTLTRPDPPCFSEPVTSKKSSPSLKLIKSSLIYIDRNCMLNFRGTIVTEATPVNELHVHVNDVMYLSDD